MRFLQEMAEQLAAKPPGGIKPTFLVMQPDGDASIATAVATAHSGQDSPNACRDEQQPEELRTEEQLAAVPATSSFDTAVVPQYDSGADARV